MGATILWQCVPTTPCSRSRPRSSAATSRRSCSFSASQSQWMCRILASTAVGLIQLAAGVSPPWIECQMVACLLWPMAPMVRLLHHEKGFIGMALVGYGILLQFAMQDVFLFMCTLLCLCSAQQHRHWGLMSDACITKKRNNYTFWRQLNDTWLLVKLTPKGVVFPFLSFPFLSFPCLFFPFLFFSFYH